MYDGALLMIREVIDTITGDPNTPPSPMELADIVQRLTNLGTVLEEESRRRELATGPLPVARALKLFRDLSANTSGPSWLEIDALLERAVAGERERYPLALAKLRKVLEKEKAEDVGGYGSPGGTCCDWPRIFAHLDEAAEESIAVAKRTISTVEQLRAFEALARGIWVPLESGWFPDENPTLQPSSTIWLFVYEGEARALIFQNDLADYIGFLVARASRTLTPQCSGPNLHQVRDLLAAAARGIADKPTPLTWADVKLPQTSDVVDGPPQEPTAGQLIADEMAALKRQIEDLQVDLRIERTLVNGLSMARDKLVEELRISRELNEAREEGNRLLDILDGLREHSTEVRDAVAAREAAERDLERVSGELSELTSLWGANRPTRAEADVLAMRRYQVADGYGPGHDDQYQRNDLGLAAAWLAMRVQPGEHFGRWFPQWVTKYASRPRHEQLAIAAAFLIAEMERLERLAMAQSDRTP